MKRLLLLCLTAAVLVSCLGLSAQAAPTLSWTEFYTMGDAASAHTRIDPIELDGTTTLFLPASVSRKAVPVYFTLSEKNAVVTATGSRGSVALKSGDTLDLTTLCEGTDGGFLAANKLAGKDTLEIYCLANPDGTQMQLISLFDNLGKGSSGAAVQCMNLMLGLEETRGLAR